MRSAVFAILLAIMLGSSARGQEPAIVDTPTVKVLRGLTVQQFEAEMQLMNQALGVSCGFCHARGNFAAETNPRKATAGTYRRPAAKESKGLSPALTAVIGHRDT